MDEAALRAQFHQFDGDGNGIIDEDEFAGLIAALGVKWTAEKVHVAFSAIDVSGNGTIEFGEFAQWWKRGK
jgi:Ca2+-binding EF-hand superfamily protein